MASNLYRHLKPLFWLLNIFGFVTFKSNDDCYTITFSSRHLNIVKIALDCFLAIYIIIYASGIVFYDEKLISLLTVLYLCAQGIKIAASSITRYIFKSKYLMCWVEILNHDENFSKKINTINYKTIKYPIVINIIYIVFRNALIIPSYLQFVPINLNHIITCCAVVYFDYQSMTLKMEYSINLILTWMYLEQLKNKLNHIVKDRGLEGNSGTITFKNINVLYSTVCKLSRNMMNIMWIPIIPVLFEVVATVAVQGYTTLSNVFCSRSTISKYFSLQFSISWCFDALFTMAIIIFPSYLCTRSVSIFASSLLCTNPTLHYCAMSFCVIIIPAPIF